jgi:glycosyltransferase involved in cell wall biosynthesis
MASRGLNLRKLAIVPNGITLEEWQGEGEPLGPAVQASLQAAHEAGKTLVGYAGSHGKPNALDTLLDAAALLQHEPLHFALVGDGHEKQHLAARVQAEGLTNVSLLPAIPKAQIPSFLSAIDIAYIGWQRVPLYRFGIAPNKLMDYMMAGCAVLHAVEAGNDPVAEAGCGLTVAPESPQAVADGLRRLAAMPESERHTMGERGRGYVLTHHTYPVLAQRFLQAMGAAA